MVWRVSKREIGSVLGFFKIMQSPFIGAYWAQRKESRIECAKRCTELLERIAIFPDLSKWYCRGSSSKSALKFPIALTLESVDSLLTTNKRDMDGVVISELGFRLGAWNGNSSKPANLSITCGAYSQVTKNAVVLHIPPINEIGNEHLQLFRDLVEIFVKVWDPDDAIATSPQLLKHHDGLMPWETEGWVNYHKNGGTNE